MKFGKNLHRYQVLEWAPFYIDYNRLKRLYKLASKIALQRGVSLDFTEFTATLNHDLNKVESFYRTRHEIIQKKLNIVFNHYGVRENTMLEDVNKHELEDLIAASVEVWDALKQLQWYGIVNFDKIVGRLAKFQLDSKWHPGASDLDISDTQLAIQAKCLKDLEDINDFLIRLNSQRLQAGSDSRTRSLFLQKSSDKLCLSLNSLNQAYHAIDQDDASVLDQILEEQSREDEKPDELYITLLHCSVIHQSKRCVDRLLSKTRFLLDFGNHIHWLVIKIGRKKKMQHLKNQGENTGANDTVTEAVNQLVYIISRLGSTLQHALNKKDSFGRLPIHHAAYYGLFEVCREILKHMEGPKEPRLSFTSNASLLADAEGFTALHLAVITGNAAVTRLLLENHRNIRDREKIADSPFPKLLPGVLLTSALKLKVSEIVQLLCTSDLDVNYKDHNGETALHLAVRSGRADYVKMIMEISEKHEQTNVDVIESVYGWTPLMMACIGGNVPVTELLLRAGADLRARDLFGWTAKDHAAFRGYLPIAERLTALDARAPASVSRSLKADPGINNLQYIERSFKKASPSADHREIFKQGASSEYSQIFVNLGPLDSYKDIIAVDLSPYVYPATYTPQREADFQVEIRALEEDDSSHLIQLPIMEDMANKPWRFCTKDASNFKLAFNIFHANPTAHKDPFIGSAVALLGSLKQGLGSTRESLIRDFTIPILQKDTVKFIGTVSFYFVVVRPFPQPCQISRLDHELCKHNSTTIIGHRGTGQNDSSRKQLQVGENTLQSFLSAIDLGASYIEFDVQLTKDNVPVIYHDFLMSETGIDAPLHNLNLEQFMYISKAQSSLGDLPSLAEQRYFERCGDQFNGGHRSRSHSLNTYDQSRAKDLVERMKHTFEFKLNEPKGLDAFKGNTRSEYIQASFMTLEKCFVELPESIGFDIEIKYPMLFEAHDWGMDTYAVELNVLVDVILDTTYRLAANRTIFFSSFSPEICILLSNKQNVYPVFFLSESGKILSADARASSLQEAIHFAKSWHLPGVISRSEPLVMCPEFVKYVKDSGLVCISWGGLNDDPEHAKTQAKAGLDAIIINNVHLISQTLSTNGVI